MDAALKSPPLPPPMDGARVMRIRRGLGLTRKQLARVLRMHGPHAHETVKRWETGEAPVTGPASVALELMDAGARPHDFDASAFGGEDG